MFLTSYFSRRMRGKSQNDLILQESQQSPEVVAGAVSLTSVLKKFITELFSGLTSSCSSSGRLLPSSLAGAFSSSAAGLSSGAALSASGSGNDWESRSTLAASSYMASQRISLWEWCERSGVDKQAVSVLIAALNWEHNSNHASAYTGRRQQSAFY